MQLQYVCPAVFFQYIIGRFLTLAFLSKLLVFVAISCPFEENSFSITLSITWLLGYELQLLQIHYLIIL